MCSVDGFIRHGAAAARRTVLPAHSRCFPKLQAKATLATLCNRDLFSERAYIDGQWVRAQDKSTFNVTEPASGDTIGSCPDMSKMETERAINVAQAAFEKFRYTKPQARASILKRWYELMIENKEDLAKILMQENGRPIDGARQEITYAASFLNWFSGEAERSYGYTVPGGYTGSRVLTIKQPIGVVGIITPWNFPSAMITRKVAGAIAAGCAVVLKPAAETPYSALALAKLAERAGIPHGVFNIVTSSKNVQDVGSTLCTHEHVKKISFTGSTRVGKLLMRQASSTLKKCSMELGGNAPFIVFDDANIVNAIDALLAGKFRGSGQTCVSPNRIFVQAGIYDRFVEELKSRVQSSIRSGDLAEQDTTLGFLIDGRASDKVERLVEDAKQKGAKVILGGSRDRSEAVTSFPATVISDATEDMMMSTEEIFGPVIAVYKFRDEEKVVAMANKTKVGLAAYIHTQDISVAWRTAEALEVGMTGINTGVVSDAVAPFGGIKESGFGREGGRYGMEEFQIQKTITIGSLGLPHCEI